MTTQKKSNSEKKSKISKFKKIHFNTIINLNNRKSLYKRQLPSTCIPFNSEEGKKIFNEALQEKNLECYFMLNIHLLTQSQLTYCGMSSLCMILNALEVDPMYPWKSGWRFFSEENIRCPPHIDRDVIDMQGITLEQFSDLAKFNFLEEVKLCRASNITKEDFIKDVERVSQQTREVMTLNFARDVIKQTGQGHVCPLGGYNKKRRMALLLDVARHKYPLYWVSVDLLWDAINTVDIETGISRGYCIVRNPLQLMKNALISYYYYKNPIEDLFNDIISNLQDEIIEHSDKIDNVFTLLKSTIIQTINEVNSIQCKLTKLSRSIFMPTYLADNNSHPHPLRKDFVETIKELYKEIKSSQLYKHIIDIQEELNITINKDKEDDPDHPILQNEFLYLEILLIYVVLPSLHKIMTQWQKKKLIDCQPLINELEKSYLEEIKRNSVINAESNFFLNSFFYD